MTFMFFNLDFEKHILESRFLSGNTFKTFNTEVVENISINDFMLETDCPFLAPHPFRDVKMNQMRNDTSNCRVKR